ncbi:MAG TPA: FkbM family methyltransferase [Ktedonobacteraceae bacterium]
MTDKNKNVALSTIRLGRRLFANTPVNKWPLAGKVRGWIFRQGYREVDSIIEYKGVRISAPARDLSLIPGLVGGYYEATELEVFMALAAASRNIIDVGGNIGLYTVLGAKQLPAEGMVYTFEPIAENVAYIHKNLALNNLAERVHVEPLAVGKEDGELTIHMSKDNVGNHSAARNNVQDAMGSVQVPRVSLDSYVASASVASALGNQVDILKIDVEGYDGLVLEGAQGLIGRCNPTLFVEFIPDLMENCGYDPTRFISTLFSAYTTCYLVDEITDRLTEAQQDSIADFTKRVSNSNLVFVSNPTHKALIEAYMAAKRAPGARQRA